jgi:uncharacterized integral membrane protein
MKQKDRLDGISKMAYETTAERAKDAAAWLVINGGKALLVLVALFAACVWIPASIYQVATKGYSASVWAGVGIVAAIGTTIMGAVFGLGWLIDWANERRAKH